VTQRNGDATRARILEALRQRPGMNKAQLRRFVGLAWTTVSYHLLRMQRQGVVDLDRRATVTLCWPVGIPTRFRPWLELLHDPEACRVLDVLATRRHSLAQLAKATGLSAATVDRRLKRLIQAGVVRKHGIYRPRFSTEANAGGPKS